MQVYSPRDFYINEKDPNEKMMDEATLSHLLRKNNSFTKGGKSYGRLLCEFLDRNGLLNDETVILEIGPGLGDIAKEISVFMKEKRRSFSYTALDISPKIVDNMRNLGFDAVQCDCLEMPYEENTFDLIITNEMISDLPTLINFRINPDGNKGIAKDAREIIEDYKLQIPDFGFNFNYGAIKLISSLHKVLKKGGAAFLSEQSAGDRWPQKISVVGHDEYTINFDHLKKVSRGIGFDVKRGHINDILNSDEKRQFVSGILRPDINAIYNMEGKESKFGEIMSGIFDPDEFIDKIVETGNLNIYNISKYGEFIKRSAEPFGKLLSQFEYLLLRKV